MVKHIIQIADLHIPNNENERPYMNMLKRALAEILKEVKKYKKDEVRIVICGDIFHNKIRATNEARKMFHETLNYLNAIAKTIIFAGNHDMLENNTDRMDSISPTFDIKDAYKNIVYIDKVLNYKSGCIKDDNIIWALYSMFDKFERPNINDIERDENTRIIGLFHGDITGAVTDTGRMSENGVPTEIFEGCDCVMAGHIHKYQTLKKNGVPIVYAGSMFQQNSGENTTRHGFVNWDVDTMEYDLTEISNDYRIYKFRITSYDDVTEDIEKLLNL